MTTQHTHHDVMVSFCVLGSSPEDAQDRLRAMLAVSVNHFVGTMLDSWLSEGELDPDDDWAPYLKHALFRNALRIATKRGAKDGTNSVGYWEQSAIGGATTGDTKATARTVLKGLEDGDPMILDTMPTLDLSGQWADGETEEAILNSIQFTDIFDREQADEIVEAYRQAYDFAAVQEVERLCREHLAEDD